MNAAFIKSLIDNLNNQKQENLSLQEDLLEHINSLESKNEWLDQNIQYLTSFLSEEDSESQSDDLEEDSESDDLEEDSESDDLEEDSESDDFIDDSEEDLLLQEEEEEDDDDSFLDEEI